MSNTVDVIEGATERRSATAQPVTDNLARWLQAIFWSAAIGLGLLQSWVNRHAMQSDGISYLDMGDAYLRGDWPMAINGYWSPLCSWLLGVALRVINPSPYWERAAELSGHRSPTHPSRHVAADLLALGEGHSCVPRHPAQLLSPGPSQDTGVALER